MKENSDKNKKSKKYIRNQAIGIIILLVATGILVFLLGFRSDENIRVNENGINISLHLSGPSALIAELTNGGYEVRFDNIVDIELLPYSARQLSQRIDDLLVPPARDYATARREPQIVLARYATNNNHRLHISLIEYAAPTIWITRYEGVPVLLSFRYGYETEALYEQIVKAWERWQAS